MNASTHSTGPRFADFLEREAQPGFAYGSEVFRMVDDLAHYDPRSLWVFRLFSAVDAAASPLGSQRLHFVPVPSGIPQHRWLYTSVRIQHVGSLTAAHRQARFDKYLEADPTDAFAQGYDELLEDPAIVAPWPQRSPDLSVLLGPDGRYVDQLESSQLGTSQLRSSQLRSPPRETIAISAVVIAQDDRAVIDRSVGALLAQQVDDDFEIIVVCSGSDGTSEHVATTYPKVRCIQLPARALPGEAWNAGLWAARGEYVTFPGSHVWLQSGSLQARLDAHERGWALVTGAVINGNPTKAGWASYFLDHAAQTPGRRGGEYFGVPGHVSYITSDVRDVGGFPEDMRAGEDTVVNTELTFSGCRTYFEPGASFFHASPSTTTRHLLHHHSQRGRALGRIIRETKAADPEAWQIRDIAEIPVRRLRAIRNAMHDTADVELRSRYREVRGLVATGAVVSAAAAWYELLAPRRRSSVAPAPPARLPSRSGAQSLPILAIGGRPYEAATGLLSAGTAYQSARRLMTFTRYARTVCDVRPALAPIVTSASVTAEYKGTYTIDTFQPVGEYLDAARGVGAMLLLQVQPGRASLSTIVERWSTLLGEPDVGIFFDLRGHLAGEGRDEELADVVRTLREQYGPDMPVLARGAVARDSAIVPDVLDLRVPGTPYPHVALALSPRPEALVYG